MKTGSAEAKHSQHKPNFFLRFQKSRQKFFKDKKELRNTREIIIGVKVGDLPI